MNIYIDRCSNFKKIKSLTKAYEEKDQVKLIQFPFEGANSKIQYYGVPTQITWGECNLAWGGKSDSFAWGDAKHSEKFLEIQKILGVDPQRDGDCRQLDTAYKNKADLFLTSDKGILNHKDALEFLLGFTILNPDSSTDFLSLQKTCSRATVISMTSVMGSAQ